MAAFEAWLVFLILLVNVVGELQRKRTLAASRGFLAAARPSCSLEYLLHRLYGVDAPEYRYSGIVSRTRKHCGDPEAAFMLVFTTKPLSEISIGTGLWSITASIVLDTKYARNEFFTM